MLEGFDGDRRLLGHHPDSVTTAIGIHLIVYCAVGACLAYGLYALLQPSRAPNSGLGAYVYPGAVVEYGKPLPGDKGFGADCACRAADCSCCPDRSRPANHGSFDARTGTQADDRGTTLSAAYSQAPQSRG